MRLDHLGILGRSSALPPLISEYLRTIAFGNVLIHEYADIDDRLVWGCGRDKTPDPHPRD